MATLIVIFVILCMWHYIAQSILIPNYNHEIRYKLYAERDSLRRLVIDSKINDDEFKHLDQYISNIIHHTKNLNLFDVIRVSRSSSSQNRIVERKIAIIEGCNQSDYVNIKKKTNNIAFQVTFKNSMGWYPYILVLLIPILIFSLVKVNMKSKLKRSVVKLGVSDEKVYADLVLG